MVQHEPRLVDSSIVRHSRHACACPDTTGRFSRPVDLPFYDARYRIALTELCTNMTSQQVLSNRRAKAAARLKRDCCI